MSEGQSDRTRTLLQGLLNRPEVDLVSLFAPGRVAVVVGEHDAHDPQAQLVASMLVNLLSRLFPVIQHLDVVSPAEVPLTAQAPRWRDRTLLGHFEAMLSAIEPDASYSVATAVSSDAPVMALVGRGSIKGEARLFVGSSGWDVNLSRASELPASGEPNPIGAYAAACMAAAEIWKLLLKSRPEFSHVPIFPLEGEFSFSTFSYLPNGARGPELPSTVHLPNLTCVGAGAGGGATLYVLSSLPDLTGDVTVVDPDDIEKPNLNRYVFADNADAMAGSAKPHVIAALFSRFSELNVNPVHEPFSAVAGDLTYEFVAAAVHSRAARRDIQFETPKVLWDCGATSDGEFRVFRHILGQSDCMWCKHPLASDPEREKAEQLHHLLGLPPETWLRKIKDHEPFTTEEVAGIFLPADADFRGPKVGERFDVWERDTCGRMKLPDVEGEVPIPFAPVMAGVLVAGEILKEFIFPDAVLDSYYWNNLVARFMPRNKPQRRLPKQDCGLCQDPTYQKQYKRRWG